MSGIRDVSRGLDLRLTPYALAGGRQDRAAGRARRLGVRGLRSRRQVRRRIGAEPRPHREHRLRAGRGGRAAGEPDPLPPLLPREAGLLPRERGDVQRRRPRQRLRAPRRPLLHAAHRAVGGGPADSHRRRSTSHGQDRTQQRRRHEHRHAVRVRPVRARTSSSAATAATSWTGPRWAASSSARTPSTARHYNRTFAADTRPWPSIAT